MTRTRHLALTAALTVVALAGCTADNNPSAPAPDMAAAATQPAPTSTTVTSTTTTTTVPLAETLADEIDTLLADAPPDAVEVTPSALLGDAVSYQWTDTSDTDSAAVMIAAAALVPAGTTPTSYRDELVARWYIADTTSRVETAPGGDLVVVATDAGVYTAFVADTRAVLVYERQPTNLAG